MSLRFAVLDLSGVTIPSSFVFDSANPTYHQEMLAYILMRQILSMQVNSFEHIQDVDGPGGTAISEMYWTADEGMQEVLRMIAAQGLTLHLVKSDSMVEFRDS